MLQKWPTHSRIPPAARSVRCISCVFLIPAGDGQRDTVALSARTAARGRRSLAIAGGTVLRMADDASVQHVGDGAVVLLARSGQLYTCNGTTEAFLEKVDGQRSLDQIIDLLAAEFEVDRPTLVTDMSAMAADLVGEGILLDPDA
jgi:pyrroloquinoline quinone biosynthesis protein D